MKSKVELKRKLRKLEDDYISAESEEKANHYRAEMHTLEWVLE